MKKLLKFAPSLFLCLLLISGGIWLILQPKVMKSIFAIIPLSVIIAGIILFILSIIEYKNIN